MKILINELFEIFLDLNLPINYDVCSIIHELYYRDDPKFILGERSIFRTYMNNKLYQQTVHIDGIKYNKLKKKYIYSYNYFPSGKGFTFEENLNKLNINERHKSLIHLPMDLGDKQMITLFQ